MKLEDIGFYSLSDERALSSTHKTRLERCELILTDHCNFKCPYCRGVRESDRGDMNMVDAGLVVRAWARDHVRNVRFSGGEPTLWPGLHALVKYTRRFNCIEHIAISTNGSASIKGYQDLLDAGVNDFSISLDACCSKTADAMSGGTANLDHIKDVIRYLSNRTYVTVGVVLDEANTPELEKIIKDAADLGVSDIRIIPSAQSNHQLQVNIETDLPILRYRLNNIRKGRHVRGIGEHDCKKCYLALDDMAIMNMMHYPCIIYMREFGSPIGRVSDNMREERLIWFQSHDSSADPICRKNCLDVCVDYNNRANERVDSLCESV